jgi:hypothetical protein
MSRRNKDMTTPFNQFEPISIDTLEGGDAKEKVNWEIQRAIDNCLDLNTEFKKTRKVTLTISMVPTEDRKKVAITYQAGSKLVPEKAGATVAHIGSDESGVSIGYVDVSKQTDIDDLISNVSKISEQNSEVKS